MMLIFIKATAQQHKLSDKYVVPSDTLVQQKLAHWQDIKFGLLMHWGTYSEWGIVMRRTSMFIC
jgi:alpha-L-fucosidase